MSHFDLPTPLQVIFAQRGTLLSGFLPFQSQYAHLVVSDKLFNDLSADDMRAAFGASAELDHWYGRWLRDAAAGQPWVSGFPGDDVKPLM